MSELIFYQIGVGLGGLFTSAFFLFILSQNPDWEWRRLAFKFTAALTFFSVSTLTQIIEETWQVISFYGVSFPPLNVFFEATILAFLVSGLWDIWTRELDER